MRKKEKKIKSQREKVFGLPEEAYGNFKIKNFKTGATYKGRKVYTKELKLIPDYKLGKSPKGEPMWNLIPQSVVRKNPRKYVSLT